MKTKIIFLILFFGSLFCLKNIFAIEEQPKNKLLEVIKFDVKTGRIGYILNSPAYVRIRTGIKFGPLQKTVVNWQRREAGKNIEQFDGFDLSGKFKFSDSKDFIITIHYFPVDDKKEFILGEDLTYSNDAFIGRISKKINFNRLHQQHNPKVCYDSQAEIKFLRPAQEAMQDGFYLIKDETTPLVIDLNSDDKDWFNKEHFDIYIFIDNVFAQGESGGYLPYNWNLETGKLPEGKHLITVNIRSLKDHITVASLPVIVEH